MGETIVIIGFGRVGQANALALSLMGYSVHYYDIQEPYRHYLNSYASVYERITALPYARAQDNDRTSYVVCVDDDLSTNGEQDTSRIQKVLEDLRDTVGRVILRSTVLPDRVEGLRCHYYVPEFLHEKSAVKDCLNPAWMVIGRNCDGELPKFLETWTRRASKVFIGSPREASFIKYLSNMWNATRVAFVNEFGSAVGSPFLTKNLSQINRVIDFILENDTYLRYGRAFGGRCLPKDVRAFLKYCNDAGIAMHLLSGACQANAHHRSRPDHELLPEWFSE